MRRSLLLTALVMLGSLTAAAPGAAALPGDVNFFYDRLAPYGDWFVMDGYGWVWTPRRVAADWRPYTRGRWAWTDDYGWLWASDEDFGWATHHYGRWFYDADHAWVWVPDLEWGPAWVTWRTGSGYLGWAPLPPEYQWRAAAGLSPDFFGPGHYVFVPARFFFDPLVYRFAFPFARNDELLPATRDAIRYDSVDGRIAHRGLDVREVEAVAGRAVPRYRVEEERALARRPVIQGNTVTVFRPTPQQIAEVPAPRLAPPTPGAVAHVRPRPVQPPAVSPALPERARGGPAVRGVPRDARAREAVVERQRQQQLEQARQWELARQREAERRARQGQAERQQQREQARQEQLARQREAAQRRQQEQAERQRQQEQAREREQARQREAAQRRPQPRPRPPANPNPPRWPYDH